MYSIIKVGKHWPLLDALLEMVPQQWPMLAQCWQVRLLDHLIQSIYRRVAKDRIAVIVLYGTLGRRSQVDPG